MHTVSAKSGAWLHFSVTRSRHFAGKLNLLPRLSSESIGNMDKCCGKASVKSAFHRLTHAPTLFP